MKKIVVALSIVTLIAVIAVVAMVFYTMGLRNQQPQNTINTEDVQSNNQDEVSTELAAELAELQALLESILAGDYPTDTEQTYTELITEQEAMDIALQHIGYGSVNDVLLFSDDGVLTFEVDIRHEEMRYMVYINALSGSVIASDSYNEQQD